MTFLFWGVLNAFYFLVLLVQNKNRNNIGEITLNWNISSLKIIFNIIITFSLTCLGWIFFRSKNIEIAMNYIKRMFSNLQFNFQYFSFERYNIELVILIILFVNVEWFNRKKQEPLSGKNSTMKLVLAITALLILGVYSDYKKFIYFQF